jgi:hypothetical protein
MGDVCVAAEARLGDTGGANSSDISRTPGAWLWDNAEAVRRAASRVASGRGLSDDAAGALELAVIARLVDDDFRVLRCYSGGAAIDTYLAVVAARVLLDQRSELGRQSV